MNRNRRRSEGDAGRSSASKTPLVNPPDSKKLFLHTLKQHLDKTMRHNSWERDRREEYKFFFLKGGLDKSPDQKQASPPAEAKVPEAESSKARSQSGECQNEFSAFQDRILKAAIESNFRHEIVESVNDLIRFAYSGDLLMVGALHSIAMLTIAGLNEIAQKKPEALRPIAREEFYWPAMISRKRSIKQTNSWLIKHLQLGQGVAFSNRGWQPSAPSTQAALDLFLTAQSFEKDWNLSPLTEKNKSKWFEVAWNQMLKEGIEPEKIPWLAPVGKSAIGKKSMSRGMPQQTDGMKRDDMRAEIKRQVRNAFDNLVSGARETE